MEDIKIGIVTVSDRASAGIYEDVSGKAILEALKAYLLSGFEAVYRCIPDDQQGCCLIVTTGGTGPAKRDVTPEATSGVCEKMMPGFGELMRKVSLQHVPTAILSRQTAGIRGKSLILNLPGKPASIRECLDAVFPAIPYCIDLLEGPYLQCNDQAIRVFRPPQR